MTSNVDWDAVRQRLDAIGRAVERSGRVAAERAQQVLEERARALARAPAEPTTADTIALVTFEMDGELAGVEATAVVEICRFTDVTVVPGAKPPVHGVAGWRGELLTLLDLRRASSAGSDPDATHWGAVLHDGANRFALLVDALRGLTHVPRHALQVPGPRAAPYVRAVTRDPMVVIDAAHLLRLYQ
jgi:purine-binding chemotaxis protein CheW